MINWTEILLALVSTVGGIVSAWMTAKAKAHAQDASDHADRAEAAAERETTNGADP